jgi:predicted nuclease of predicted toxin-antitoxin system
MFSISMNRDLQGLDDASILSRAEQENRVVITHDSDFGQLAIVAGCPFVGIVYLRPGHIRADFTIESLKAILSNPASLTPKFIIVARRTNSTVHMRIRNLS